MSTLFPLPEEQQKPQDQKQPYKSTPLAKSRYNLTHRVRAAGVKLEAKTRSFDASTLKHADPLTRRRVNKLMKQGFAGELKIDFPE